MLLARVGKKVYDGTTMDKFIIQGGTPLQGEFIVRGSKNAATKMMIASLLTDEECSIDNVPLSAETDITRELCEHIGSVVTIDAALHRCTITTKEIVNARVSQLSRKNRIPILAFGPLLHRKGVAELPVLGGCPIGHRPINFHIEALKKLGAYIQRRGHSYYASAKELTGAAIILPYPSVGATENILLTAVLAKGLTTITNAATEPEIINLIDMLRAMGAHITTDIEKRLITIHGVATLHGAHISVIPDRNEVISIASGALATSGNVFFPGIKEGLIETFLEKVKEIGASYEVGDEGIGFSGKTPYHPASIVTSPHPGFMTDWQQPFAVVLAQANDISFIHETVYEDRLGYLTSLQEMGANVIVSGDCVGEPCRFHKKNFLHSARIQGPNHLKGRELIMPDVRAGMALVIAALAAKGTSTLSGVEHIERGYEALDERLTQLGAHIQRVTV